VVVGRQLRRVDIVGNLRLPKRGTTCSRGPVPDWTVWRCWTCRLLYNIFLRILVCHDDDNTLLPVPRCLLWFSRNARRTLTPPDISEPSEPNDVPGYLPTSLPLPFALTALRYPPHHAGWNNARLQTTRCVLPVGTGRTLRCYHCP